MSFIRSIRLSLRLLFLVVAFSSCCRARFLPKCIISSDDENRLYLGLETTINVSVEKRSFKEINLSGKDVRITRENPNSCEFRVKPLKEGQLTLYVSAGHSKDSIVIYAKTYQVRRLPYKARLTTSSVADDSVTLEELQQRNRPGLGIYLDLNLHLYGIRNASLSFIVAHYRGDSIMKAFTIQGEYLTEEFNAYGRQSIRRGDHLVFFDIKAVTTSGIQKIDPLEVTIK